MNDASSRIERMQATLNAAFRPTVLEIADESHRHAGHAGAATGKGHFRLRIVSAAFAGKPLLQRHRMVYAALEAMMVSDIHALSIDARSPEDA